MIWKQNKKITRENRLCIEPPKVILGGLFFNNNFVLLIYKIYKYGFFNFY